MTVTEDVHALLAGVRRLELAQLPTPLHSAPRLSDELGAPIWFKRDDLTGVGLGGNKARALEYLLADADSQGCDCLVTGAGSQSNWTMLAALTALRCGLEPFVVCYGDPVPDRGNMLLHRQIGTNISFTGDPERSSVDGAMELVARQLSERGRWPYVIPRGGATSVGALGYVRASFELAAQLSTVDDPPSTLWLAAGSGGTCAGLVAGAALLPLPYDIVGITVSRPVPEITAQVRQLADGACALVGSPVRTAGDIDIRDGWIGPGYGVPSPEGARAAVLVARTESVFLDPIFGAKAMAALIQACRSGEVPGPVIFLVSGGTPTLFAGMARR